MEHLYNIFRMFSRCILKILPYMTFCLIFVTCFRKVLTFKNLSCWCHNTFVILDHICVFLKISRVKSSTSHLNLSNTVSSILNRTYICLVYLQYTHVCTHTHTHIHNVSHEFYKVICYFMAQIQVKNTQLRTEVNNITYLSHISMVFQ